MGVEVVVAAPVSDEASTPLRLEIARAALDADLADDCANLGITRPGGDPFDWWLDACDDPVVVWVGVSDDAEATLRLGTALERPDQDPEAVFGLFDDFEGLDARWTTTGSAKAQGTLTGAPEGAVFSASPVFGPGTTLAADVIVGSSRPWTFEIGTGAFTVVGNNRSWAGNGGWTYADATNGVFFATSAGESPAQVSTTPLLQTDTRVRVELDQDGTLRVNGFDVAGPRSGVAGLGDAKALLVVGGNVEVDQAFVRPTALRSVTSVRPLGPGGGPSPTDSEASVGDLPTDPGCACDATRAPAWPFVLLALGGLRRRR